MDGKARQGARGDGWLATRRWTRPRTRARDRIEVAFGGQCPFASTPSLFLGSRLWLKWYLPSQSQQTRSTASYTLTSKTQASGLVSTRYVFDVNHHCTQASNTVPSCSKPRLNSATLPTTTNTYLAENSWSSSARHCCIQKSKHIGKAAV